jgi:hypothetical protein
MDSNLYSVEHYELISIESKKSIRADEEMSQDPMREDRSERSRTRSDSRVQRSLANVRCSVPR